MDGWHQTVVVTFCASVPGDAPLVVRTNRSTKVLYVVLMVATVLLVVADVALVLLALLWSPILFVYVPLVAVQFWFVGRILREYQGLLGPQLAADHTGVWVRTGTGSRPEVVYLPWQAIDGIDAARKGPAVRVMSRQGEALYGTRSHWRVRALRRRFGTSFAVDGKRSVEHPDQIAHRLWQLAEWARR
jgi:hypothetical protein